MTYAEAVEFLLSLVDFERLGFHRHFAEVVGLDSARQLLAELGDPHLAIPAVHIAGTKGKGSTAAMVESILRHAGYRTGLFTSPHLVSFRERVQVSGEPIPEAALAQLTGRVRPVFFAIRENPDLTPCTFFEVYFAIAALHLLRERVDIAVYETGLGGRLDATNLLRPVVSAITTIGFDHMAILGNTLDAIAREKAGIAKAGVPLVVARNQPPEAMQAIKQVASEAAAPVLLAPEVRRLEPPLKAAVAPDGSLLRPLDRFVLCGPATLVAGPRPVGSGHPCSHSAGTRLVASGRPPVASSLLGAHQATNLGVALGILDELAVRGYTVNWENVASGLQGVRWPGRFDLRDCRPWLILDVAHNQESALALARALREYLDFDRLVLVVGMSEDKDIAAFASGFADLSPTVVLTRARMARALRPEELRSRAAGLWEGAIEEPEVQHALTRARCLAGPQGAVCVTGSFYVVGEAMTALDRGVWGP